jgi:hypothetical protein
MHVLPSLEVKHPTSNVVKTRANRNFNGLKQNSIEHHKNKGQHAVRQDKGYNGACVTWPVALVGVELPRKHAAVAVVEYAAAVQLILLPHALVARPVDEGVDAVAVPAVVQPGPAVHFAVLEGHHA